MSDRLRLRPQLRPIFLFFVACATMVVITPTVHANTITVTTIDDELNADGDCSLREAIVAANTDAAVDACPPGSGADTILVPSGAYTLALSGQSEGDALTGDLDIRDDLPIVGAGKSETIIDGNGLDRVFQVDVASTGNVYIDGVAITGGNYSGGGGGIYINSGSLTLVNSRVAENEQGGLVVVGGASLNISSTEVRDNQHHSFGGGIDVFIGSLSMTESVVDGNLAAGGGGIRVGVDGTAVIYKSTISNNIAESSSYSGGGLWGSGPLTIVNSTISGNSSRRYAGGLLVGSGATSNLYNVTIVDNIADSDGDNSGSGGGIHIASGTINLQNTIIARNVDNSSSTVYPDCSGTLISQGHNLIQDLSGCTITGSTMGNLTGIAPALNPLSDNGGPTMTHALLPRSPAIDAGDPGGCLNEKDLPLTVDQRGYTRPVNGDAAPDVVCDIGAFEHLSPGPPKPPPSPTPTATTTASATPSRTRTSTATATTGTSPTPTNTATVGPSPTPTVTATIGPSPTPTITVTPGPSPTPTNTVTPGPSPTPTATSELPQGLQQRFYLPLVLN